MSIKTSDTIPSTPLTRRRVFAGAGTAGALAAVAAVLPQALPDIAVAATPKPAPAAGGGYQVSAHVLRYYQTTQV